jgi:hypothetical protein
MKGMMVLTVSPILNPMAHPGLKVLKGGVAYEVAILTVLARVKGLASAVKEVGVEGEETHGSKGNDGKEGSNGGY